MVTLTAMSAYLLMFEGLSYNFKSLMFSFLAKSGQLKLKLDQGWLHCYAISPCLNPLKWAYHLWRFTK